MPARAGTRIVEIGPGGGALTGPLLERGFRVLAIELDRALAADLRERWGREEGFDLVEADALEITLPPARPGEPLWVVGNLPYAITSPLLFHVLEQVESAGIAGMVFMIQREVAERLAAEPGTKAYGALTVGVRLVADVERVFDVRAGAFRPPPSVVSAVVRLIPHDRFGLDPARRQRLRSLVQALFGQRRKQIQKSLRTLQGFSLPLETVERVALRSGLDLARRPETLSPEEFLALDVALMDARQSRAFSTPPPSAARHDAARRPPPKNPRL